MTGNDLSQIAALLRENDRFAILTHRRPDGDTIGSAAALCRVLRALGKRADVLENSEFTEKYRPWLRGLTAETPCEGAFLIAVDVAAAGMLGYNLTRYAESVDLLIDHHGRNRGYAHVNYVEPQTAACGEILLRLTRELGVTLTREIAEAVYLAVSTDTGCFRYSNTTGDTLRAALACKEAGADTFSINKVMFMTRSLARLRLEAHLTETLEFYAGGAVALCAIDPETRDRLGITPDDVDDLSGFAREIAGVEIGIMLRQGQGEGKISVRTSDAYNAAEICALLGGGGHAAAAGASVPGGIAEAHEAILRALRDYGVKL